MEFSLTKATHYLLILNTRREWESIWTFGSLLPASMKTGKITLHWEELSRLSQRERAMVYSWSQNLEDLLSQEELVESQKKWRVTITYNNDGKFIYDSTEQDSWLAIAVATKQMFNKCIWLEPKATRITGVLIEDFRFVKELDGL